MSGFFIGLFWFAVIGLSLYLLAKFVWHAMDRMKVTQAKMDLVKTRETDQIYWRAATELDDQEERREKKRRMREMRRQIEDANGETPPWRRRR
ncbi:hypothetical protein RCF27_09490 [Rhodococcus pyridinivorans]|uniref:hypothetical protein n=1 Tax=Rhodococcus pyridinivorans TaxID=103816 RepID=UPI00280C268D|nr:hypothetical protein [Rhodococcus pyridinivorans]WMM74491.1 hypothetical protein RCF27_09490 [Rhodococcus pyridinivorans]